MKKIARKKVSKVSYGAKGWHFGPYGGRYVPETLMKALNELEKAYALLRHDKKFHAELKMYLRDYVGRPSSLYEAKNLTRHFGKARIFLKREDLNHTGAHKINSAIAQGLLAKKLGKKRIVVETGAGQHGVASATAAALLGLECVIYMGAVDVERQALNVYKMKLLRAKVIPVTSGSQTLKDATNEAIRDWVANVESTYYLLGSAVGPHPYPGMVRDFQAVIGKETKQQMKVKTGKLPNYLLACVGGGSNAIGFFSDFLNYPQVKIIGIEASGKGVNTEEHAASITKGTPGILHGMKSYLLQENGGQVKLAHSISAGLDYPSVGPQHAWLKDTGRVLYDTATDADALAGFKMLTEMEGIMPALETSHAIGYLPKLMPRTKKNETVVICISGRGDKDINTIQQFLSTSESTGSTGSK